MGLGPFVETLPASGAVGRSVIVLGNNLTGTTSVTFNGIAAALKVVSSTEITATLPKGATTGKVNVKTPSRTLTSNVTFRSAAFGPVPKRKAANPKNAGPRYHLLRSWETI